jgi:5'-nucleotidase
VTITVIGTNDTHGQLGRLPLLGGYLAAARAQRAIDGGHVVVVDAGDMFQGTLESNLNEGAAVLEAYAALGYAAAALGNHEFDFGPAGEAATPQALGDDPRGALKQRALQASALGLPLLAANVIDSSTGAPIAWPGVAAWTLVDAAGVRVAIVGVTTVATPQTTIAVNFEGLAVAPLAPTIVQASRAARAAGAEIVLVAAHAGGRCERFDNPDDLSSCATDEEIFQVARALPAGTVDVIVAGHSHRGVAHRVHGVAVIESYAGATAFGRVDLVFDRGARRLLSTHIHPPRELCAAGRDPCEPGAYEGERVQPDARIAEVVAAPIAAAQGKRAEAIGVVVAEAVVRAYGEESALGNLFADLMLAAQPAADVAITNGGGLRADLPAGKLQYGQLYEAAPFDNRFALVRITGAELARMFADNLRSEYGILSIAGAKIVARCADGEIVVDVSRTDSTPIAADDSVLVATSDFLATGGDGVFGRLGLGPDAVTLDAGPPIRDAMARELRRRGGTLRGADHFDPERPRLAYPAPRPVRCDSRHDLRATTTHAQPGPGIDRSLGRSWGRRFSGGLAGLRQ